MRAAGVRKPIKSAYFEGLSCPLGVSYRLCLHPHQVASTIATRFVVGVETVEEVKRNLTILCSRQTSETDNRSCAGRIAAYPLFSYSELRAA